MKFSQSSRKKLQVLQDLKEQARELSGWLQSLFGGCFSFRGGIWSWLMPLLIPIITIWMLLMIVPCIINCLTHFVSAQVNKLQHAVLVQQRFIKLQPTRKYHSALDGLHYKDSEARLARGGGPVLLPIPAQEEVTREISTILFPKNWASLLLKVEC